MFDHEGFDVKMKTSDTRPIWCPRQHAITTTEIRRHIGIILVQYADIMGIGSTQETLNKMKDCHQGRKDQNSFL